MLEIGLAGIVGCDVNAIISTSSTMFIKLLKYKLKSWWGSTKCYQPKSVRAKII